MKLHDAESSNQNTEIAKVNIGFDCENSIVLENLNRTCKQIAEISRENIGFHYE